MAQRVVIVGAGVIGAACAHYLSQTGVQVTLVDRGDVGGGTSSRGDGNVLAIDKDPGFDSQMARVSQELLHILAQDIGPVEYRRPGSYLVLDNGDEIEPAKAWVAAQQEAGLPFAYLDGAAIHHHLPDLAEDVPGGLYCASDSTLNPLLYTQELARSARSRGAVMRTHQPVAALETDGGAISGVRLQSGEVIACDVAVVAAGVWTPPMLAPLGVSIPVQPRKGQILVSGKGPLFGNVKVMEFGYLMSKFGHERRAPQEALDHGVALVYEPTLSHNFLLGSSREFGTWDTTPDDTVNRIIARRALRFYPAMQGALIMRSYAGLRPWTPDHFPVVSWIDAVPGLLVAAGHEGDGIGLAAVTGRLVADLIADCEPIVDPAPLRWDRFGAKEAG
jgi:glycine/D-amino acid oxidase-like deaminating enzyme